MDKVLNQDEIDEMFRAARGGNQNADVGAQKIAVCNFRQAGQIGSEQVRAINALHEGFARNLTHWLGAYLRTVFECNLVSAEQIPYREVLARVPEVAYLASFQLQPIGALAALQLDLSLAFPIIDVLLGGRGRAEGNLRDLTEIEEQVLEGVVRIICRELQTSWQPLGLQFVFDQRQQATQMQRLMAPNEMTLSLSFEIRMPDVRGTLNLVFPSVVSSAMLRKLAREWAYHKPHGTAAASHRMRTNLMDCEFTVEVAITDIPAPISELLQVQPGTVLPLRKRIDSQASVLVNGTEIFNAAIVRQGQIRAGQIRERVAKRPPQEGQGAP